MEEGVLLNLLAEALILNALHVAGAVRTKTEIISGLRRRIEDHDLENAVRDYIAENPWLLSPEWETFRKETSVRTLVAEAARDVGLDSDGRWSKRVELAMSSGRQLLIVKLRNSVSALFPARSSPTGWTESGVRTKPWPVSPTTT